MAGIEEQLDQKTKQNEQGEDGKNYLRETISAPQKGWSSTPSSGVVLMSKRAIETIENSDSNSFSIDLKKWYTIMKTYESGGHAYHTTMPTDSLCHFRDTMLETKEYGFDKICQKRLNKYFIRFFHG